MSDTLEPWTRTAPVHIAPYARHTLWGRQANQKVRAKTQGMLSLAPAGVSWFGEPAYPKALNWPAMLLRFLGHALSLAGGPGVVQPCLPLMSKHVSEVTDTSASISVYLLRQRSPPCPAGGFPDPAFPTIRSRETPKN